MAQHSVKTAIIKHCTTQQHEQSTCPIARAERHAIRQFHERCHAHVSWKIF